MMRYNLLLYCYIAKSHTIDYFYRKKAALLLQLHGVSFHEPFLVIKHCPDQMWGQVNVLKDAII